MQDPLSRTFSALADPTRRAILARLRLGAATVTQIAEPFRGQMTLPGVTKHLKVLERYNQPVWYLSTEDYTRWAREQYDKERRIIQSLGLAKKLLRRTGGEARRSLW